MILDERLEFCENYDLDQEAGTYLATNQIDLGSAPTLQDIGNGQPVYLVAVVTEAFTDGGDSATLDIRLVSDDTASIHASTSTIHLSSGTILKAALALGTKFVWQLPVKANYERYLGINFVVATAGFDTGMITAGLTMDPHGWVALPDAL
jgi:hypothetical protein